MTFTSNRLKAIFGSSGGGGQQTQMQDNTEVLEAIGLIPSRVWDRQTSGIVNTGSVGKTILDDLNATLKTDDYVAPDNDTIARTNENVLENKAFLQGAPLDSFNDGFDLVDAIALGTVEVIVNPTPASDASINSFTRVNGSWEIVFNNTVAADGAEFISLESLNIPYQLDDDSRLVVEMRIRYENVNGASTRETIRPVMELEVIAGSHVVGKTTHNRQPELKDGVGDAVLDFDFGKVTDRTISEMSLGIAVDSQADDQVKIIIDSIKVYKTFKRSTEDFKADVSGLATQGSVDAVKAVVDSNAVELGTIEDKVDFLSVQESVIQTTLEAVQDEIDEELNRVLYITFDVFRGDTTLDNGRRALDGDGSTYSTLSPVDGTHYALYKTNDVVGGEMGLMMNILGIFSSGGFETSFNGSVKVYVSQTDPSANPAQFDNNMEKIYDSGAAGTAEINIPEREHFSFIAVVITNHANIAKVLRYNNLQVTHNGVHFIETIIQENLDQSISSLADKVDSLRTTLTNISSDVLFLDETTSDIEYRTRGINITGDGVLARPNPATQSLLDKLAGIETAVGALADEHGNLTVSLTPALVQNLENTLTIVSTILKVHKNKRMLDTANARETFYDDDNTTPILENVYKDAEGNNTLGEDVVTREPYESE